MEELFDIANQSRDIKEELYDVFESYKIRVRKCAVCKESCCRSGMSCFCRELTGDDEKDNIITKQKQNADKRARLSLIISDLETKLMIARSHMNQLT